MNKISLRVACFFMLLFFSLVEISGCNFEEKNGDTVKDKTAVDYAVCFEGQLPDELSDIIEERKEKPFKLSYRNNEYLYIAVGYGAHEANNFCVGVKDLFKSSKGIFIGTEIFTDKIIPEEITNKGTFSRYPYVVIRCKEKDLTVFFD